MPITITTVSPARKNPPKRLLAWVRRHKFIAFLVLALAIGGYYYFRPNSTEAETRYVFSAAATSSIVNTVEGSGSVEAAEQVDLKPQVSSEIIEVYVRAGQEIKAGEAIVSLDTADLEKAVREARNSLASAQASLASKLEEATEQELKISENSVKTAKLAYEQAQDDLVDAQYDNSVTLEKAQRDLADAQREYDNTAATNSLGSDSRSQSLDSAYHSAQSSINSAYLNFKSALVAADDILGLGEYGENSRTNNYLVGAKDPQSLSDAKTMFYANQSDFEAFDQQYQVISNSWSEEKTEQLLDLAYSLAVDMKEMADELYDVAIGSVSATSLTESEISSFKSSASSQQSSLNSLANSLQSAQQNIASVKTSVSSSGLSSENTMAKASSTLSVAKNDYEQAQKEAESKLKSAQQAVESKLIAYENAQAQHEELLLPPRETELTSARLQVSSAQEEYEEALSDLAAAEIFSPIDGKVAKVYQSAGDDVSSETAIVSIITDQSLAAISLNEVDIAKVEIGQKAVLTFSSIEDLAITGEVISIDSLGESTQGVVTYEAKIAFDAQDDRVKPQMSVDAEIIVNQRVNALAIPNSALETDADGNYYVKTIDVPSLANATSSQGVAYDGSFSYVYVTIGLADDAQTEILGGLEAGTLVVTRTISASTTTKATTGTNVNTKAISPTGSSMQGGGNFMIMGGPGGGG